MLKKIIQKHQGLIAFAIFGLLTTAINYAVYLPCYNVLGWSSALSNVVAWAASVAFAFVTNKPFVFHSHDWSAKVVWREAARFVGCRLGSGFLETIALLIMVDYFSLDGNWMKIIIAAAIVTINYIGSKMLVFRNKG